MSRVRYTTTECEKCLGKRVQITTAHTRYGRRVLDKLGTVEQVSHHQLGVRLDDLINDASRRGIFWLTLDEVKVYKEEETMLRVKVEDGYKALATVVRDGCEKEYVVAVFPPEEEQIRRLLEGRDLEKLGVIRVVCNITSDKARDLCYLKGLQDFEGDTAEYDAENPVYEVISVCNDIPYYHRLMRREKLKDLQQKQKMVRQELRERLNRLDEEAYMRQMAEKFAQQDPSLKELVAELDNVKEELRRESSDGFVEVAKDSTIMPPPWI